MYSLYILGHSSAEGFHSNWVLKHMLSTHIRSLELDWQFSKMTTLWICWHRGGPMWGARCLWSANEGAYKNVRSNKNTICLIRAQPIFNSKLLFRECGVHAHIHSNTKKLAYPYTNMHTHNNSVKPIINTLSDTCKCVLIKETNERKMHA